MELLLSKLESRVKGYWELRSYLDQLRNSLLHVNHLMDKAEWWRFTNPYIAHLLKQLRDAAYDAEDVIAMCDYYELKQMIESQIGSGQHFPSLISVIKNLISDSAGKIKNVQAKIDFISTKLELAISPLVSPDGLNPRMRAMQHETSSVIADHVLGRKNEMETVVKLLLQPGNFSGASSINEESIPLLGLCAKRRKADDIYVLPIVGIGGVGKTTLAQLIYNDERVKNHFDLRIWACVSDYFDLKKITRTMIQSANVGAEMREPRNNQAQAGIADNCTNLESLQQTLKEKFESRRCLIVLDDVWHENFLDFESLCKPLRSGLVGTIILITTRLPKVAKLVGTLGPIELENLAEDVYWDLFKKCAFGTLDSSKFPALENIGKKIANKLKGSPLAAKTLGGVLRANMTIEQWKNILNSELWQIEQADGDILPTLRVSYQHLPVHLRRCFHILTLFPKDFDLSLHYLSPVWVADGIVNREDENCVGYFLDFINRSFFIRDQYNQISVHDLMHDLAKYLSMGTYYCLEEYNWGFKNHNRVRHLSVYRKPIELINKEICNYKNLRSLLFLGDISYEVKLGPPTLALLFKELQFLRFLHLEKCQIWEIPENIGNLKLLIHINLSFTRIRHLPDSLCQLYNLQVVNVEGCPIESFPKNFTNLINLRLITEEMGISSILPHIGKLIFLEKLPAFEVLREHGHKIQELKNMTQLRGHITVSNLENVVGQEDAAEACLNNKKHLTSLSLIWSPGRHTSSENSNIATDEDIIKGLEPHTNLESLCIENYGGRKPASWLQTEKLPRLYSLVISEWSNLQSLEYCFVSHQPSSLQKLHIKSCVNLHSLPLECFRNSSMTDLIVTDCPKLCCPSNLILPPTLLNLKLDSCGDLDKSFPNCLANVYSLNLLELYDCQHVTSLPRQVTNHLKILKLKNCIELQHIELSNSSILEDLLIVKCPKLLLSGPSTDDNEARQEQLKELHKLEIDNTSLLKLSFLRKPSCSLKALVIWGSPEERMFTGNIQGWLNGLENLEELAFGDCLNLESLPQELPNLYTVKRLEIINCSKIQSLPENGLPPLLNSLYFFGCLPALTEQLKLHFGANRMRVLRSLQQRR